MVVFTCNHCGDTVHKPKVEKHYSFVCRTGKSLTCVDCLKDFRGEDYAAHTKCVTEEERYSAKGSIPGGIVKKGEVKQESWMEMLKRIVDRGGLRPPIQNLLTTMLTYSNIPRKKPKFMNFMKSCSGSRVNMKDVEEVWDIIESYKKEDAVKSNGIQGEGNKKDEKKNKEGTTDSGNNEEVNLKQNGIEETKSKKKKKRDSSVAEINGNEEKSDVVQEGENNEKPKDKKKKKTKDSSAEGIEDQPNVSLNGSDAATNKDKKKKKKGSTVEDNSNDSVNEDVTKDIKEKKNKKKSSSAEEMEDNPNVNSIEDDTTNVKEKKKKGKRSLVGDIENKPNVPLIENGTANDKKKQSLSQVDQQEEPVIQNGDNPNGKNKLTADEAEEAVPPKKVKMGTDEATFDFKENILTVLTAKGSIPLKKLEKKVLKAYKTFSGESECSPKVIKKFNKSLKRLDNVEVNNDVVQLKK